MKKILGYINPVRRFGVKRHSWKLPLISILLVCILSEIYSYVIAKNPHIVGVYIIYVTVFLTIYFSLRDGVVGGFIVSTITVIYYFYIVYSRHYHGILLETSIITIIILGILYFLTAGIIGWLRIRVDRLIEKEADEKKRLQSIIQQLPVGVLITDNSGKIVDGNKFADKLLGIKVPLGLKIKNIAEIKGKYPHQSVNASLIPLAQTLSTGKPVLNKEFKIVRPNEKKIFLQTNASIIHNTKGKIIAAAVIVTDITAQKELELRKDDFINMASHELKTPITSMKLYIESLLRSSFINDSRSLKTLNNIKNQTERLQELVEDLLDVSRLQTGKLTFRKQKFNLQELLADVKDSLQNHTKQQEILLRSGQNLTVYADKFRIYQVMINLLTNAVKYSPPQQPIQVTAKKSGKFILVSVRDYGIGIAKSEHKKIFDRLYQVSGSSERTFPGIGMGLYISREIVKRHRGRIWVESDKGKGSTFYFSLPA